MDGRERGRKLRDEIFATYEARSNDRRPNRIRPSELGHPCLRYLWIRYRWGDRFSYFDGRMHRLFETGHLQEDRMANDLRSVGASVTTRDPDNPTSQLSFEGLHGHVKGFLDGIAEGVPHAHHDEVLTEMKTHNAKSFKDLDKNGVAKSKVQHYAQMQLYMLQYGLKEGLYIAVNKDDDDVYCEFIEYNDMYAQGLRERAETILYAKTIPPRISESLTSMACRFCSAAATCHNLEAPAKSCRTCRFGTPLTEDGQTLPVWQCGKWGHDLDLDDQIRGCSDYEVNEWMAPDPAATVLGNHKDKVQE